MYGLELFEIYWQRVRGFNQVHHLNPHSHIAITQHIINQECWVESVISFTNPHLLFRC